MYKQHLIKVQYIRRGGFGIQNKERNNDYKNQRWTREEIAKAYKYENPDMEWKECRKKANDVFRELKRLNNNMKYNNNKYYKKFIPLSMFESENGEYDFYSTDKTEDDYYR